MRRSFTLGMIVLIGMATTPSVEAGGLFDFLTGPVAFQQAPSEEVPPLPVPDQAAEQSAQPLKTIELYPCVTYKDKHEMAPCAEPVVVCVPDPCSVKHPFYWLHGDEPPKYCETGCGQCGCCPRPMAYVEICVPQGCPVPQPTVSHHEREYTYDFGAYSVDVRLKRGEIEVDYQD